MIIQPFQAILRAPITLALATREPIGAFRQLLINRFALGVSMAVYFG